MRMIVPPRPGAARSGERRAAPARRRAALLALAPLLLLPAACGEASRPEEAAEQAPLAVGAESVYRVATAHLATGPLLSGSLEPEREATLRAEVSGAVVATAVEEGQAVPAGAVLGRIDDSGLRESVLSAESAVRSAEGQLEVARRNAERAEALVRGGAIAEREAESARWNVTNAQAALADARSRLALAREQLGKTVVRAPFAGVISERSVAAGDTVEPGRALFTLVDPRRMRLVARVPAAALGELRIGMPVEFTVAGLPQRFRGEIERVNPVLDPATRQVEIHVALPNESGRLAAGLYAEGRVAAAARDVLAVPVAAIDRATGEPGVLRVAGDTVERVPVELGIVDEESERVEVRSGVAEGDLVLIGAARGITPGARVRVEAPGGAGTGAAARAEGARGG